MSKSDDIVQGIMIAGAGILLGSIIASAAAPAEEPEVVKKVGFAE